MLDRALGQGPVTVNVRVHRPRNAHFCGIELSLEFRDGSSGGRPSRIIETRPVESSSYASSLPELILGPEP
jgi:hypothetical protein